MVLVGCEFSGIVRDAFTERGHDAWSCDLLPCEASNWGHLRRDVFDAIKLDGPWDLIILHPPCTHLAVSGNRWYAGSDERSEAIRWTHSLWTQAIRSADKVALENPVGVLSSAWRKPDQYIQPWEYGHGETKKTGLWLHSLPKLRPTEVVEGREQRVWKMGPSPERSADRSRTYEGIAAAMADQWGH